MNHSAARGCGWALGWLGLCCGGQSPAAEPAIEIGAQAQVFLDTHLIERLDGVTLQLHRPVPRELAITFDRSWEGPQSGYVTVFRDEDRFRMYYRGGGDLSREYTCYAESRDGVHWQRPSLGLFEHEGSKNNNIVWTGTLKAYVESHNFTPFRDLNPQAAADERYKAVALDRQPDAQGERRKVLVTMVSADGIGWRRVGSQAAITEGSFDSQNTVFWHAGQQQYVCFLRTGLEGVRHIARTTSPDFVHWSPPQLLDFGAAPREHFYTNAILPYPDNENLLIGMPMRFVPQRKSIGADERAIDGVSDAVLISSRDGLHWQRTFLEAFLRPGLDPRNWGHAHGNNTPAWGLVSTGQDEWSVYWCEHYGATPRLRRGTIRQDGFASVHATYHGGQLLTRPLVLRGRHLALNCSTSAVGQIQVELQLPDGSPVPGYRADECLEIYGDETARIVRWQIGSDLSRLSGQPVRLRIVMKDADLYAVRQLFPSNLIPGSHTGLRPGK